MNLEAMNVTAAQREAITCIDRPLVISAGAGSGKTFTLQQRIVYALSPESGPLLSSVEELCAITFTEKAAAEIKSRVRSALRAEGMRDQALRVDAAWISTIHGMCSRILREHALELGIAPDFVVPSGVDAQEYANEAVSRCLQRADEARLADDADEVGTVGLAGDAGGAGKTRFAGLEQIVQAYGTKASSSSSLPNLIFALIGMAARLPGGFDDISFGPRAMPESSAFCRSIIAACDEALTLDLSKTLFQKVMAIKDELVACLNEQEPLCWEGFLERLGTLSMPRLNGVRDEGVKEAVRGVRRACDEAFVVADLTCGRSFADDLLAFAREVRDEYAKLVRGACALDTDMLLSETYRALREVPGLAEQYRRLFRLVMVDEFQDTNALQTAIIKLVCRDGLENLCTVGDSQQSIYGFQGADVGVYRAHKAEMTSEHVSAKAVQLDENFRSHRDILQFVERVCGATGYFPEPFLALSAGRDEQKLVEKGRHYKAQMPRLSVSLAHVSSKGHIADAHRAAAAEVAAWFSRLREAGHSPQQMAVLFGVTTQMAPYAEALREAGFSCAFSGGSKFFEAEEVRLVGQVLAVCANAENTEALFAVLSSGIFRLCADDFVFLGTKYPQEGASDETVYRADIFLKFLAPPAEGASRRLRFAQEVLQRAWKRVGSVAPHEVVRLLLAESGWFSRCEAQGAQGLALVGNVSKALGIIGEIEQEPGFDMAQVAARFNALSGEKEHMGVLAGKSSESIRLMTVHGAKGLEFPFVAVVDCYGLQNDGGPLVSASVEGRLEASLLPPTDARKSGRKLSELEDCGCETQVKGETAALLNFRRGLDARRADEALAEKRRLFYVAATRASEAMLLSLTVKGDSYAAIHKDIAAALFGDGVFPEEDRLIDYGGSEALQYRFLDVESADGEDGEEAISEEAEGGLCETDANREGAGKGAAARSGADASADNSCEPETYERIVYPIAAPPVPLRSAPLSSPESSFVSYSSLAARHAACEKHGLGRESAENGENGESAEIAGNDKSAEDAQFAEIVRAAELEETARAASLAAGDEEERGAAGFALADADKATDFGTALHRLCQLAALVGEDAARGRIDTMALTYGVNDRQRLAAAFERWLSSDVKRQAWGFARRLPELPFALVLDEQTTLEGEIDLFCDNGPLDEASSHIARNAFIVDYKTGGSPSETPEQLFEKHRLQASCYALAALSAGYREVELHFVRVEQPAADDAYQPQVVSYRFATSDCEGLLHDIKDL